MEIATESGGIDTRGGVDIVELVAADVVVAVVGGYGIDAIGAYEAVAVLAVGRHAPLGCLGSGDAQVVEHGGVLVMCIRRAVDLGGLDEVGRVGLHRVDGGKHECGSAHASHLCHQGALSEHCLWVVYRAGQTDGVPCALVE